MFPFFSKSKEDSQKIDIETSKLQPGSNPWGSGRSHRDYNEMMTKLILSRNTPVIRSPQLPTTSSKPNSLPKITLFDGFTNAAIASRYKTKIGSDKHPAQIAALVYCSAGMIGGQLSSAGGTHFAQEESTVIENPLVILATDQALSDRYGDSNDKSNQVGADGVGKNTTKYSIARTEYPLYRLDEVQQELSGQKSALTTSYGFLIDNVVPLALDDNKMPGGNGSWDFFKNPSEMTQGIYISYLMQAAIHLGLTDEDENTNFMFSTNLDNILTKGTKSARNDVVSDFRTLRHIAQSASNFYDPKYTPNVPQSEPINSSSDAFNAFSSARTSRIGLRYAMKSLLFSPFNFHATLQNNGGSMNQKVAQAIFQNYNDNYQSIESAYESALRTQILNQVQLTQAYGKNILITGAYGCGVYNNDWQQVARAYGSVLREHGGHLDEVIICNRLGDDNRAGMIKFCQVLITAMNQ